MSKKKAIQRINQATTIKVIELVDDGSVVLAAETKEAAIDYIQSNDCNGFEVRIFGPSGIKRKLKDSVTIVEPTQQPTNNLGTLSTSSELLQFQLNHATREISKLERDIQEYRGDLNEKKREIEKLKDESWELKKKIEFQKERFELETMRHEMTKKTGMDRIAEVLEKNPSIAEKGVEVLGGLLMRGSGATEEPDVDIYGGMDSLGSAGMNDRQAATLNAFSNAIKESENIDSLHVLATWLQADPDLATRLVDKMKKQA